MSGSSSVGRQIIAKFAERVVPKGTATGDIRLDLYLADWSKINEDSAKVLVGWAHALSVPTNDALDNFILAQFDGKLQLSLPTVRIFPSECVASFVLRHLAPTRRLADATSQKEFIRIAPLRYLEAGTDRTWDVREGEDGTKYLMLVTPSNLEELLDKRKRAAKARRRSTPTFEHVAEANGLLQIDTGDTVKFYHRGLLKEGKVASIRRDGMLVVKSAASDTNCVVSSSGVIDVVNKDPESNQSQKEKVRKYWESIFPKEYVDRWLGAER